MLLNYGDGIMITRYDNGKTITAYQGECFWNFLYEV